VLMRFDAQDSAMSPIAPPCITEVMTQTVPVNPAIGFVRTPAWDQVEQVTKDGFRELIETANEGNAKAIDIVDLPEYFDDIYEDHRIIMEADLARSYADEYKRGKSVLSTALLEMIERGQKITSSEYDDALEKRELYNAALDEIFESYDAIITPATLGPAPTGLEATGNPVMNTIWTFCGMPAINLPLLQSTEGLPFGVQLVGNKDDDARLFRTGRWLLDLLND
jgi:Asp-tRNA(Asn)/Glu-tRNA(Gln) amidotransferase A subunit family amidase